MVGVAASVVIKPHANTRKIEVLFALGLNVAKMNQNTQITPEERSDITGKVVRSGKMVSAPTTDKLLLCLLETVQDLLTTVQDLKKEVAALRASNDTSKDLLHSIITPYTFHGSAMKVHKV